MLTLSFRQNKKHNTKKQLMKDRQPLIKSEKKKKLKKKKKQIQRKIHQKQHKLLFKKLSKLRLLIKKQI